MYVQLQPFLTYALDESSQNNAPVALSLDTGHAVAIKLEAEWVQELVWKIWRSEACLGACGNRTNIPGSSSKPLVTIRIAILAITTTVHEATAQTHVTPRSRINSEMSVIQLAEDFPVSYKEEDTPTSAFTKACY